MEQCLVTIVVPTYKVEKYLNKCIESLVSQTYRNLEIILVDDCSPDGCPQICDEWEKCDSRIHVIHKEKNEGLGMARNTGMNAASGKYICFFDSDDYVLPTTIEKLVSAAERENADLTVFGIINVTHDEREVSRFVPQTGEITYRGKNVQESFLPDFVAPDPKGDGTRLFYMSSCLILYNVKQIREKEWQFVSEREIISEDVYSLLDLMDGITSVTVVPEALYCYRCNNTSLSRSYKQDRYEKIRHFYLESMKLCRRKGYNADVCHRVSKPYLAATLGALKQEANAPLPFAERLSNVYKIFRDETLQQVLQQNKSDNVSKTRRIIFFLMRKRCWLLSYLIFRFR